MVRWHIPDERTILVIALLLTAVIAGFLLRIPSHPMLSYGPSADVRASRSHRVPSGAILPDIFCVAWLVILPILYAVSPVEHHSPVVKFLEAHHLIPALRC